MKTTPFRYNLYFVEFWSHDCYGLKNQFSDLYIQFLLGELGFNYFIER